MNIQSIITNAYATSVDSQNAKGVRKSASISVPVQPREAVVFSDSSKSMAQIREKINSLPEVRIELVEKIKEKIKNNDYPIENRMNDAIQAMWDGKILAVA